MVRRVGAWILGILLGLTALYVVAANVILRTSLLRKIMNGSPNDLWVDYASAYSVVPGRIHVEGLRLRGSDHSIQWILGIDRCDFHAWPLDAFRRRFHAGHIRADGVTFRIRMKMERGDVTPEVAGALPPITGFSDPPYLDVLPPPPSPTDADYHLISIQLDDVVADHVHEIWTHTVRLTGDMDVTGRWLFRPVRWLDVGPATVAARELNVSYGPDIPLAEHLHGGIALQIHPFDLRIPEGAAILDYVSARTELAGQANGTHLLETMAGDASVKLLRGEGAIDLRLNVDYGKLVPETRVTAVLDAPRVEVAGVEIDSQVNAELRVDDAEGGPVARLSLAVVRPSVTAERIELVRASAVSATVNDPSLELARLSLKEATFSADFRQVSADSAAPTRELLLASSGVDLRAGRASAEAHAEGRVDGSDVSGTMTFGVRGLDVARGADEVTTDAEGMVQARNFSLSNGHGDLGGSELRLGHAVATIRGLGVAAVALKARATRATIGGNSPDVRIDVDAPGLDVADLRPLNRILPPETPITLLGGSAHVAARIGVDLGAKTADGSLSLNADDAIVQLGSTVVAGNVAVNADRAELDWGQGSAKVRGLQALLTGLSLRQASTRAMLATSPRLSISSREANVTSAGASGTALVDLTRADVPDLVGFSHTVGVPAALHVEQGRAAATLHVEADLASLTGRGEAQVWTEGLHVRLGSESFATNLAVTVSARPSATRQATTDFSGSSLAATSDAARGEEGWWARATATQGSFTLSKGLSMRTDLSLEAKDAAPAQALVATLTGVPRWLVEAAPMSHLTARATLATSPTSLDVRGLQADGGATSVKLEFARRGDEKLGGVLVTIGNLRLGVNLGGTGPGLILVGAEPWFWRKAVAIEQNPSLSLRRD